MFTEVLKYSFKIQILVAVIWLPIFFSNAPAQENSFEEISIRLETSHIRAASCYGQRGNNFGLYGRIIELNYRNCLCEQTVAAFIKYEKTICGYYLGNNISRLS